MLSGAGPCGGKGPCPDSAESGQPTQAPGPMAAGERASLLQGKGAKGKSTNEVSQAHSARGTKGGRKLEGRLKGAAFFQRLNKLKFFYNTVEREGGKKNNNLFRVKFKSGLNFIHLFLCRHPPFSIVLNLRLPGYSLLSSLIVIV